MLLADEASDKINEAVHHTTWGSGLLQINTDTIRNTWIAIGILLVMALLLRSRLRPGRPGLFQGIVESIVEFIHGLVRDTIGEKPIRIAPLAISLFIFLLVANWLGLVPTLRSPTNDVNTALALAIMSIALLHFYSVRFRRPGGYLKHYFTPNPVFFLINLIEEFAKLITLPLRLYFNIFVGELMLVLIIVLFPHVIAPVPGIIWVLFSVFVGIVQAFIFTMLTISYIAMGTETGHGDEEHGDDAAHGEEHSGPGQMAVSH